MVPFNYKAIMVKIRCIFQVILAADFMEFHFTKMYILLQCWQRSFNFCDPPTKALPANPTGGLMSHRPRAMSRPSAPTMETDLSYSFHQLVFFQNYPRFGRVSQNRNF